MYLERNLFCGCSISFCRRIHLLITWEKFVKYSVTILSASIFSSGRQKGSLESRPRKKEKRHEDPEMTLISTFTCLEVIPFLLEILKYPCTPKKSHTHTHTHTHTLLPSNITEESCLSWSHKRESCAMVPIKKSIMVSFHREGKKSWGMWLFICQGNTLAESSSHST